MQSVEYWQRHRQMFCSIDIACIVTKGQGQRTLEEEVALAERQA